MSDEIIRVNTVLFNFKNVIKPSWIKLHAWLKSTDIKDGDADVVAFDDFLRLAIVKFENAELFDNYIARHPTGVVEYVNDEGKFQIRFWKNKINTTKVKIKNLPKEADEDCFVDFLNANFGKVESTVRNKRVSNNDAEQELIRGSSDGVLFVWMEVTKNIPSLIIYRKTKLLIDYAEQLHVCRIFGGNHKDYICKRALKQKKIGAPIRGDNFVRPQATNEVAWQVRGNAIIEQTQEKDMEKSPPPLMASLQPTVSVLEQQEPEGADEEILEASIYSVEEERKLRKAEKEREKERKKEKEREKKKQEEEALRILIFETDQINAIVRNKKTHVVNDRTANDYDVAVRLSDQIQQVVSQLGDANSIRDELFIEEILSQNNEVVPAGNNEEVESMDEKSPRGVVRRRNSSTGLEINNDSVAVRPRKDQDVDVLDVNQTN